MATTYNGLQYGDPIYADKTGREKTFTGGGYTGMSWDDFVKGASANGGFQKSTISDPYANPFQAQQGGFNPEMSSFDTYFTEDPNNPKNFINMVRGADGNVAQSSIDKLNPKHYRDLAIAAAVAGGGMAYGNGLFGGAGAGAGGEAITTGAFDLGGAAGGVPGAGGATGWTPTMGFDTALGFTDAANAAAVAADSATASTGGVVQADAAGKVGAGLTPKQVFDGARALNSLTGSTGGQGMAGETGSTRIDPRMDALLYGKDGKGGFLDTVMGNLHGPQKAGMSGFGGAMDNYLGASGAGQFGQTMNAANGQMNSNIQSPQMQSAQMQAALMQAAKTSAPMQNSIDLMKAFNDTIYGEAGNNPYLTGAIQKGINQSNNAFGNMVQDATKATQGLLGNIRGGAIVNGAMGSSRQGIAEGQALESLNTQMARAASQFGQNNTDAAVAAQAGAFDADRNRALSAMTTLNGNQYGVAAQDAGMQQAANQANAGFQQQANANNAGWLNAAAANNQQAQMGTNQLNSANRNAGIAQTGGLLGTAYGMGQQNDQYNMDKIQQTGGLLSRFTGLNPTSTQPEYKNNAGNIAGGILGAAGVYNAAKGIFGF